MKFTKGNWKVGIQGGIRENYASGEISIVHEDNHHGFCSFGWKGPDKIILFDTDNMPAPLWPLALEFAQRAADAMTAFTQRVDDDQPKLPCPDATPALPKGKTSLTVAEAEARGYKVIVASPFEVGLTHWNNGVRTWFGREFDGKLPPLDHPTIMKSIMAEEKIWESLRR